MTKGQRKTSHYDEIDLIRQNLFDIEPELRMLEGVAAILLSLSTAADQVEPVALAPLAHLGSEALEQILTSWRKALAAMSNEANAR
ncbi:MAG: hypothetical protein EOS22_04230 [Mesorhizobium sp.]|uniref:hypothetical protein n=1 Tax=Mesorhizobium sp. TaxID=1871066 RepID=UPI000FE88BD7|nr:hypothetical protein [Mesorhizobium sp.]RWD31636.1 MAG: hypothetical protein EOS22_04230 [Mesorhizobium sp.]TJW70710.1 MAG: hypothetical protein E5V29_03565 [Mesorhizobium sp.]